MTDETFVSITISFPTDMITFLDEEAGRLDRNRSQIVREAIRQYKENQKKLKEGKK